jgi:hypothetical protein
MDTQIGRHVDSVRVNDAGIIWRHPLSRFVLSNPGVPRFVSGIRVPDLELTLEAAARFEALANEPHDPAASKSNVESAMASLRRRRASR